MTTLGNGTQVWELSVMEKSRMTDSAPDRILGDTVMEKKMLSPEQAFSSHVHFSEGLL